MCDLKYVGQFCKVNGGSVLGFSCMKNGNINMSYYDPQTGLPYTGSIDPNCSAASNSITPVVLMYNVANDMIGEDEFTNPLFSAIPIDQNTGYRMVWVTRGGALELREGVIPYGFAFISSDTIQIQGTLTSGEILTIKFFIL